MSIRIPKPPLLFSRLLDCLFVSRGVLLAVPGLALAVWGTPSLGQLAGATPLLALGLGGRIWAVAHIGMSSRTRSAEAPVALVKTGPYAFLQHPLYCANLAVALGLVLFLRPPGTRAVGLVLFASLFYWLLSYRETTISRGVAGFLSVVPESGA